MLYLFLAVIAAVLLFGAGAVRGAIATLFAWIAGLIFFVLIVLVVGPYVFHFMMWLGVSQGNVIPTLVIFGCGLMAAIALIMKWLGHDISTGQKRK